MPSSSVVSITIAASSLIIASKSSQEGIAFLDIEVVKETEKAILVVIHDADDTATTETEWIPKKALIASKIMGNDVYTVADWFNERIDHDKLNGLFAKYGYTTKMG